MWIASEYIELIGRCKVNQKEREYQCGISNQTKATWKFRDVSYFCVAHTKFTKVIHSAKRAFYSGSWCIQIVYLVTWTVRTSELKRRLVVSLNLLVIVLFFCSLMFFYKSTPNSHSLCSWSMCVYVQHIVCAILYIGSSMANREYFLLEPYD